MLEFAVLDSFARMMLNINVYLISANMYWAPPVALLFGELSEIEVPRAHLLDITPPCVTIGRWY